MEKQKVSIDKILGREPVKDYEHHQWHNSGYRPIRPLRYGETHTWDWAPKYNSSTDKRRAAPQ